MWANVFSAGAPSSPFIYFAREPAAVPFWKTNPNPPGTENRVEFFANLYSAFKPGNLCFEIHDGTTATDPAPATCSLMGANWNPTITNQYDLWQVVGHRRGSRSQRRLRPVLVHASRTSR